jgi:hypothetical protein
MKISLIIATFILTCINAFADHWLILVNGERVFECISTCSNGGLNTNMLMANVKLKAGDKITVVYTKDSVEAFITKNIIISDSVAKKFQTFSIYDAGGDHACTVRADDFASIHKIVIWYSEKKVRNNKETITKKIPLVYFD